MTDAMLLLVVPLANRPRAAPGFRPGGRVWTGAESDRRLGRCVECALAVVGYRQLRRVAVSVRGRCVTLRGAVPCYYLKQLAQTAALATPGVRGVQNDLTVTRPD